MSDPGHLCARCNCRPCFCEREHAIEEEERGHKERDYVPLGDSS